jgi:AcrR family transcriptional regulator
LTASSVEKAIAIAAAPARRSRRPADVARAAILAAARQLFAERGYAGATTREIAKGAGTSEVVLFRHFRSKAELFGRAVFEPFDLFIREYMAEHAQAAAHVDNLADDTRDFVEGLYRVLLENKALFLVLIATEAYEDGVTDGLKGMSSLRDYFAAAEEHVRGLRQHSETDLRWGVRISFAMIAAMVLFQDWITPDGAAESPHDELIERLTSFISVGFRRTPQP